jgi:hypothetical protein
MWGSGKEATGERDGALRRRRRRRKSIRLAATSDKSERSELEEMTLTG